MTREELIAYDRWLTENKWGSSEIITPEQAADLYLAKHPLPPAEGAEHDIESMRKCLHHYINVDEVNRYDMLVFGAMRDYADDFAAQQQPTAEGAEEILDGFNFMDLGEPIQTGEFYYRSEVLEAMNKFATLHAQRLAEKMVEEDDLQKLMNDISEWSDKTFGNGQRNPAIIYHLKKEVDELIAAIEKTNTLGSDPSVGVGEFGRQRTVTRVEYADCLMLLLDSAHHFGISAKELLSVTRGKLEINKVRKWGSPDENGVVEHIE